MSTPPDFTGPGYFAGESPDGLTTVAGIPVTAQVQVLWRDPADPAATETLVAQTTSAPNGTWQITDINPTLRYIVRGRTIGFDDVTIVGAIPTRTDQISAAGHFTTDPDTQTISGQVAIEGGLPPFAFTRLDAALAGIEATFSGRHVSLSGFDYLPAQPYQFAVQVQTSNGLDQEVLLPIYAGLGTPQHMQADRAIVFEPTFYAARPVFLFDLLQLGAQLGMSPEDADKDWLFAPSFFTLRPHFLFNPLHFAMQLDISEEDDVFIKLTWKDPSAFGNGFKIWRDANPIDPNNLPAQPYALVPAATGPAPQNLEWIDEDVTEGQTYHYAVESYFADESKITASKALTATPIPTVIGEYFYGGYYVGNITTDDGTYAVIFAAEEADVTRQWKTANTTTPGTLSDTDGWANTLAMTADGTLTAAHPAAAYCRAYDGGGFDDWYLPARNELLLPWTNRAALSELNMGANTTYLWSSTQHPSNANGAWTRRFSDGSESSYTKNSSFRVRPCRRLKLAI